MKLLEAKLHANEPNEDEYAEVANDASLLEILIYKAEQELNGIPNQS